LYPTIEQHNLNSARNQHRSGFCHNSFLRSR
jgi:hypothetical protein